MLHDIRWTSQKINQYLGLIEPLVYRSIIPLPPFHYLKLTEPSEEPLLAPDLEYSEWPEIRPNSLWGGANIDFMLRTGFQIPLTWAPDDKHALYLPIGEAGDFSHPEALAYIDGKPFSGIDRHHQEILLPGEIVAGQTHQLALHGWTGSLAQGKTPGLIMGACALVDIDQSTREFITLARIALGVANRLDEHNPIRSQLLNSLNQAFLTFDLREPIDERIYRLFPEAQRTLMEGINQSGTPLEVDITAIGHAHLDLAWLWTLAIYLRQLYKK
jgi:alpha-mannosidase